MKIATGEIDEALAEDERCGRATWQQMPYAGERKLGARQSAPTCAGFVALSAGTGQLEEALAAL
jgi:hypothetical protein